MKKGLIIIILILTTGCKVKYDIEISDNLELQEKFEATESSSYFEKEYTYYEQGEAIENLWNNIIERYSNSDYEHSIINNGVLATNSYNNLNDYINRNPLYNQYFEKLNYNEDGNIATIETTGIFYPYNKQDPEKFPVEDLSINIKVPYKVIENNADDVKNNVYTWNINKYTEDKKIYLKFDKSKLIKQNKLVIDFSALFGIICVVGIALVYIYYRIKRNDDVI